MVNTGVMTMMTGMGMILSPGSDAFFSFWSFSGESTLHCFNKNLFCEYLQI